MTPSSEPEDRPRAEEADEVPPPDREPVRPFDLAEALAREAGSALRGASPVAAAAQTLLQTRHLLQERLDDAEGSLAAVILARLQADPPLVAGHFGDPAGLLRAALEPILASTAALEAFVREVDARWGRDFQERPRFDRPDGAPAADDPYPLAQVRAALQALLQDLPPAG